MTNLTRSLTRKLPILLVAISAMLIAQMAMASVASAGPGGIVNDRVCAKAADYLANNPNGKHVDRVTAFEDRHCESTPVVNEPTVTSVVSTAPCTVTVYGTGIGNFEQINVDFYALVALPSGFQAYLDVYQPGDPRNEPTTTVNVATDSVTGDNQITIYDPAICGQTSYTTTVLLNGGTTGIGWYEEFTVQS
jgi:hypothetical protein